MNNFRTVVGLAALLICMSALPASGSSHFMDGGLDGGGGGGEPTNPMVYLSPSAVSVPAGTTVRLDWWSEYVTSCTGTNFSTGGATGGFLDVVVNATTNYFISCTGFVGPASASATVTVTASGADLVALEPMSVFGSLTPGQNLTFSGVLKNVGNITAPGGFQFRYQLDLGGDGTYDINFDGTVPDDVTASQTRAVTSSAWEALPGLHGVRLCVDIPPYDNGVVTEHTESNNCGAPLYFTVSSESNIESAEYSARCTGPVLQASQHMEYDICLAMCSNASAECCTVQHNYFHNGNEREPQWAENYDCTAHSGPGTEFAEPVIDYGVHPVWGGDTHSYWQTTWTAVFPASAGPLEGALVANPTSIDRGESSLLSWSSTLTGSCTPTATNDQWYTTNETPVVFWSERLNYPIDCGSIAGGYAYWNQTTTYYEGEFDPYQTVCAGFNTITGTQAMPGDLSNTYRSGTACTGGAGTCTGDGFDTGGATSGSVEVSPLISTTYTLSCTNGVETIEDAATVTVENILSVSCQASPNPADLYETVTWTSVVSGGTAGYTYAWGGTDNLTGTGATVAKSYTAIGTKNATLNVVSGGESVTTSCHGEVCQETQCTCAGPGCDLIVEEGEDTDLSASTPTLASGINEVGNSVTFSGTITNEGNNTVTGSFSNRFQVDRDADGSYDFSLDVPDAGYTIGPAGSEAVESPAWADLPMGLHAVRFCSDLPPYPDGSVTEGDEGNNCSADLLFSVGDSLLSLMIDTTPLVKKNNEATITWSAQNADSCTVSGPGLSSSGTSGSATVVILAESTYIISCSRGAVTLTESATVRLAPAFEEF